MKPKYDLIEYWKIKRTRNIIENDFSYHVNIYLDSESKLDSSEQGSEKEFAFILAHFSAFLSTRCCHWSQGLGYMLSTWRKEEKDPGVSLVFGLHQLSPVRTKASLPEVFSSK